MKFITFLTETDIKKALNKRKSLIIFLNDKDDVKQIYGNEIYQNIITEMNMEEDICIVEKNKINETFYKEMLEAITPSYLIVYNNKIREMGIFNF